MTPHRLSQSEDPYPRPPVLPSPTVEMAAIALGGAIGSSLRHSISIAIAAGGWHGALTTMLANLLGSFLFGLIVGFLESGKAHPLLRPFLNLGVFGSFTTFSALAWENRVVALQSGEGLAAAHLAGSILSGLAAFALGEFLSHGLSGRVHR